MKNLKNTSSKGNEIGEIFTCREQLILDYADSIIDKRFKRGDSFTTTSSVKAFLKYKLSRYPNEYFAALFLDTKHCLIAYRPLFRGTIDACTIYPRDVVLEALKHNAGAVIFIHNHPSGNATPSQCDKVITKRLVQALALIDIKVLDHLIVAGNEVCSMAEIEPSSLC